MLNTKKHVTISGQKSDPYFNVTEHCQDAKTFSLSCNTDRN